MKTRKINTPQSDLKYIACCIVNGNVKILTDDLFKTKKECLDFMAEFDDIECPIVGEIKTTITYYRAY